jgi:hypothetical protein
MNYEQFDLALIPFAWRRLASAASWSSTGMTLPSGRGVPLSWLPQSATDRYFSPEYGRCLRFRAANRYPANREPSIRWGAFPRGQRYSKNVSVRSCQCNFEKGAGLFCGQHAHFSMLLAWQLNALCRIIE